MTEQQTSPAGEWRVRRRRVSKRKRKANPLDGLRGPAGGRVVAAIMLLLAVGYGAFGYAAARRVADGYAGLAIGASRAEVRYQLGAPQPGQEQQDRWDYPSGGASYVVRFDSDGRLASILCASSQQQHSSLCPPVYGVVPGTGEGEMQARLGPASSVGFVGKDRQFTYAGLGVTFVLAQAQVVAIEHHRAAPGMALLGHVGWQLLP